MTLQSKEKLLKHGVAGGTPAGAKDLWPHLQAPWLVGEVEPGRMHGGPIVKHRIR